MVSNALLAVSKSVHGSAVRQLSPSQLDSCPRLSSMRSFLTTQLLSIGSTRYSSLFWHWHSAWVLCWLPSGASSARKSSRRTTWWVTSVSWNTTMKRLYQTGLGAANQWTSIATFANATCKRIRSIAVRATDAANDSTITAIGSITVSARQTTKRSSNSS